MHRGLGDAASVLFLHGILVVMSGNLSSLHLCSLFSMYILLQYIDIELKMNIDFACFFVIYLGLVFFNLEFLSSRVIKEKLVLQRGQACLSASVPLSNNHVFPGVSVL